MAEWIRQGTGTAPSATNADLVGQYALDNATAPPDFDPANVNSVRTQWTITGSGFNDDSWTNDSCAVVGGVSSTEISQHPSAGGANLKNESEASDHTDSTGIPAGLTVADWEGAFVRGDGVDIPDEWVNWNKVMGPDGSTLTVSALTVTIDYTPAAPAGTLDQANFRIRSDDTDTLNGTTDWAATLNTGATIDLETRFRIRFEVEASGGAVTDGYRVAYNLNSGGWNPVPTTPLDWGARASLDRIEAVDSKQYADGDPTTNILSGSAGTFVAGEGVEEDNLTGSISLADTEHTEIEFCLLLHRYGDGPTQLNDGDTIQFRVERDDGTALAAYTNTPTVTVNYPAGLIGGVYAENPGNNIGPIEDANGNKYVVVEPTELDPKLMMLKSTDGGDTWAEVDGANRPATTDVEGLEFIEDTDRVLILHHPGGAPQLHIFNLSNNASPDVWATTDETIDAGVTDSVDQQITGTLRADGTVVAVYTGPDGTNAHVIANIRSAGGVWGTPFDVWDLTNNNNRGVIGVAGESDNFYVFSNDVTAGVMYGKRINGSTDALEDLFGTSVGSTANGTTVDSGVGTSNEDRQNIVTPIYWNDGADKVWVGWVDDTTGDLEGVVITVGSGGSVGTVGGSINDANQVAEDSSSRQPMACFVRDNSGDLHAFFAVETTGGGLSELSHDVSSDDGATWTTDETVTLRSPKSRINWVRALIDPAGSAVQLFYDDASGVEQNNDATGGSNTSGVAGLGTGFIWYDEFALAASGVVVQASLAVVTVAAQTTTPVQTALAVQATPASTASQAQAVTPVLAAVAIQASPAALAASAQTVTPVQSAFAVQASPAQANTDAQPVTPSLASVAVQAVPASLTTTAQATTPTQAPLAIQASPANVTTAASTVNPAVSGAPVTVQAAPATITSAAQTVAPTQTALTVTADPAALTTTGQPTSSQQAALAVSADPATTTATASVVSPQAASSGVTVQASPGTLATSAQTVTPTTAALTVQADPATLTVTGQVTQPTVAGFPVVVQAAPASVTTAAQTANVVRTGLTIQADPATVSTEAQALVPAFDAKVLQAVAAVVNTSASAVLGIEGEKRRRLEGSGVSVGGTEGSKTGTGFLEGSKV